jgi:hypothetical protein
MKTVDDIPFLVLENEELSFEELLLKNNIEQEELFKLTKQNIKYFELEKNVFENTLKYCLEKEYLTINNSGLMDF